MTIPHKGQGSVAEVRSQSVHDGNEARPSSNAPRNIVFVKDQGVMAEALGISPESTKKCEELVERAVKENRSLRWIVETANENLDLSDAEWTVFMYTVGWWDHMRRG